MCAWYGQHKTNVIAREMVKSCHMQAPGTSFVSCETSKSGLVLTLTCNMSCHLLEGNPP